jgi:hypothetical protein
MSPHRKDDRQYSEQHLQKLYRRIGLRTAVEKALDRNQAIFPLNCPSLEWQVPQLTDLSEPVVSITESIGFVSARPASLEHTVRPPVVRIERELLEHQRKRMLERAEVARAHRSKKGNLAASLPAFQRKHMFLCRAKRMLKAGIETASLLIMSPRTAPASRPQLLKITRSIRPQYVSSVVTTRPLERVSVERRRRGDTHEA